MERTIDAHFYTLVTKETKEMAAHHRQLFMTEQTQVQDC